MDMKQRFLPLAFSVSCGLFCAHSAGAAAPDLLGSASWALLSPPGSAHLNGKPAGMTPVLNVTVTKPASPYYQIQLTHDISAGVSAGTRIRCQFMARSATHSTFHAVIEKRTAPLHAPGRSADYFDPSLESIHPYCFRSRRRMGRAEWPRVCRLGSRPVVLSLKA